MRAIHILTGSSLPRRDLEEVTHALSTVFRIPIVLVSPPIDLSRAFDASRGQFNSTVLLAQILSLIDTTAGKFIAVVDVDLFIPVLTFVFGEAQLDGSAAIVSTQRLSNQFYGLPPDQSILRRRLEKEIIHELGHTFGLYHCRQFECVMRSSTYVEEIDLKQSLPCASCRTLLQQKVDAFTSVIAQ